ncbi:MAG: hypothetical protein JST16_12580 [Bdellovibrionales bacterium]|nr:hypothetical protein [Bdellovibrionales bacterium]
METFWDATIVQPNFTYPEFSRAEPNDYYNDFRALACPDFPQSVRLHKNLTEAVREWLREVGAAGKRVAIPEVYPHEFLAAARELHCTVDLYPRDPDDMQSFDFESCAAVLWTQPSRVDGFYYPDENFLAVTTAVRKRCTAPFLCEESNNLFCLNEIPPGKLPVDLLHPLNSVVKTLQPTLSPHGPALAWRYGSSQRKLGPESVAPETVFEGYRALSTFSSRQGAAFAEFERKILLVEKGTRTLADALKPAAMAGKCSIPLWPESGFHLILDVKATLQERGMTLHSFCEWLEKTHSIKVEAGDAFGVPTGVRICFAATPKWLEGLGQALCAALANQP